MYGEHFYILLLLLLKTSHLSYQSANIPPPPSLTVKTRDVEVDEKEDKFKQLGSGPVASCLDEDPARAYIQSISPSSPCGAKCFSLLPCGPDFCMYFAGGQGSLNYAVTPVYTVTLACTDDVESPTTEQITVTVRSNTPPTFDPLTPTTYSQTIDAITTKAGDVLAQVNTKDHDNDTVFYTMSTNPNTDYLAIGYSDGKIRAKNDLRFLCDTPGTITASVKATDNYNPAIGPATYHFTIDPNNQAPVIKNLDTTVSIKEKVGKGSTVLKLDVFDNYKPNGLNFHMYSTSDAGMEQYELETTSTGAVISAVLKTRIDPNYERPDTRSVLLYIVADDGYCKSPIYSLTVNIEDVNEPPTLFPPLVDYIKTYEGDIDLPTGLTVIDEDLNEVHTFSKVSGDKQFNVDPSTGNIYSLSKIDVEGNCPYKGYQTVIKVSDKGQPILSSSSTMNYRIYDANDNPPYFLQNPYTFAATACTEPGTTIGKVTGDDDDCNYNNNDVLVFGGGGGKMAVMSNGDVVLTQYCIEGEGSSGSATIEDQGIYPGPLTGVPATLSMTCGPCPPPTPAPTPGPAATAATPSPTIPTIPTTVGPKNTTVAGGRTIRKEDDSLNELLAWLIPAIIGGLVWLALTAYLIYRYCCPCRNPCAGRCKRRPKPPRVKQEKPQKPPKPEKPKKVAPPPRVAAPPPKLEPPPPPKVEPPPPPPPPPPEPESYLFGFWKEGYSDQDQDKSVQRHNKPKPIESMPPAEVVPRGNAIPPENLKLGNPGIGQHGPKPPNAPFRPDGPTVQNVAAPPNNPSANPSAPNQKCAIQ